jgi:hypothetical protein
MLFSLSESNVPSIDAVTMLTYFPPVSGRGMIASIRKELKEFMNWIQKQCSQEWSCDLRNRMAGHGMSGNTSDSIAAAVQHPVAAATARVVDIVDPKKVSARACQAPKPASAAVASTATATARYWFLCRNNS